jgi:hypothetical protein
LLAANWNAGMRAPAISGLLEQAGLPVPSAGPRYWDRLEVSPDGGRTLRRLPGEHEHSAPLPESVRRWRGVLHELLG